MAKKVSFNDIPDKNTDWGLDESNGFPFSGQSVQKYIKKALDSKAGILYYDTTNNRYLVFSDAENRDIYLKDPTRTDLLIGTFDAPFNYTAEINILSSTYNTVFLGSTGNYIDFTFDVKNKQGSSTGENVTVTYTFIRNANKKVITETRRYGESVHFNVDDYIETGTNTVIVGIMGQTTLAATTVAITYQVIDLKLVDEFDVSNVYNLANGAKTMEVFFTVSGYGTKTVEWFLDGVQLPFVKSEDEVVDVSSSRTKYITLSNLTSGVHSLQIRAYTLINGEKFYTDTLYREIMINNGDVDENLLAISTSLPHSHGIVNDINPLVFYGAEQYLPYEVRFATRRGADVTISLGSTILTTLTTLSGRETTYSVVSNKAGTLALKFTFSGVEREIPFAIANTSLNIEEITSSLSFDFSARGRSNSSVDKDIWKYGVYTGVFSGFNWNASSGWVNNSLLINSGASFSVDIAPLAKDATSTGKTLEFEFSTRNVENDEAVICNLISDNGAGLLITASEARLISAAGETVSTKFKAGEVNRIAFVINRKTGTTYKGLAFIYVNGILSGAINFGTADNYTSSKTLLFSGSEEAQVELRSIRFYDTALSAENILNNYILYRDTLVEMLEVYYRNDIYEDGTVTFSPDKAQHRLPVMIVTGDIPTLEAATSTSTQVIVDVDYVNEQDPSKNFKMKGAAMRIQGTSSLAYPRKNFRIYTEKSEGTVVYDANGAIIQDKLYAFKDGAQPVNCWCLKADFAESSGTHNTGIARLWNDAMYNAIIQHTNILNEEVNGYALRTKAQSEALKAGYTYDVRTTIDGFPILLFYKRNASDTNLIFLGKYNFNNDKSTPSVFGFEGIPGFDNSRMQCWETKDNGHPLGLFTDISGFDEDWEEAFESRYPESSTPNTADLKAFSLWINGVSQANFATEKWAHLDVYKVAAYYVYLMRFGAVDQTVKNGFITSEDGVHFFYINYDNDTINGLINTGELRLDPEINRQTIGSDGEYVYAGHDSVLWNKCEADTEFMEIVKIVDNAMYSAGLRYDNVIYMFNDEQASKWVERVYNQDAEYKYILPFVNAGTNNLFMLQGSRSSHRSWWLSKRFSLYDSLFVSGNYRDRNISFKCLNDTKPGQKFTITAGTSMNYGYGVNNGTREVGISLANGDSHTFTTTDTLNLGDVVKIFTASNLFGLDLSAMASRIAVLDVSASFDPSLGSKLKNLILGGVSGQVNTELSSISGLDVLKSLQELNIVNFKGITSLDLSSHTDFRKLYAVGSNLASVLFSKGAPVEHLELPASILALELQQLPYINTENLVLESKANLSSVRVIGCPNLSNNFEFVYNWVTSKTANNSNTSLIMDNIVWDNVGADELLQVLNIKTEGGNLDLKGKITLPEASFDKIKAIEGILGYDVFNEDNELYIKVPSVLYIEPHESSILEGETLEIKSVVYPQIAGLKKYSLTNSRTGASIDEATGVLTTTENGISTSTLNIKVKFTPTDGSATLTATTSVSVVKRVYPTSSSVTINGSANPIESPYTYTWATTTANVTGNMVAEWALSGDVTTVAEIEYHGNDKCILKKLSEPEGLLDGTLTLTLKKVVDGSTVATATKELQAMREGIIITSKTNPGVQAALYNSGLVANENYTLKEEAESITAEQLQPGTYPSTSVFNSQRSNITSFDEFKYFTGVASILDNTFANLSNMKSIVLPETIKSIGIEAFSNCSSLVELKIPEGVTTVGNKFIIYCRALIRLYLPSTLQNFPIFFDTVRDTDSLSEVHIADLSAAFKMNSKGYSFFNYSDATTKYIYLNGQPIKHLVIPSDITKTNDLFMGSRLESVDFGSNVTSIGDTTSYGIEHFRVPGYALRIMGGIGVKTLNSLSFGNDTNFDSFSNLVIEEGTPFAFVGHQYYSLFSSYSNRFWAQLTGNKTYSLQYGAYFSDMTTSKTIDLEWTGSLEDLTERLKIGYLTITIHSNKNEAQFKVDYTDINSGEETSIDTGIGIGRHVLPIKPFTKVTITPITEYEGMIGEISTIESLSYGINEVRCNYIEKLDIYIQHIDGTLYTTDEWSSGGYANDQANGVALVSASTSFVIAKFDALGGSKVQWGGYDKKITDIVTSTSSDTAVLDFDGEGNTTKILEQLTGYTDSNGVEGAPAAFACSGFIFPNGKTGYMGALGQWELVFNNKVAVNSAMSLIGGAAILKNIDYWSSTQHGPTYAWYYYMYYGSPTSSTKNYSRSVRAFASL